MQHELSGAYAAHPDGVVITVWAVPGASRTQVGGMHDGALRVRVAVPAQAGKANEAIAEALGGRLGVRRVRLLDGRHSRRKRFLASGATVTDAERLLGS